VSYPDNRTPRFCLRPRSIASCSEICKVPATGFSGTLPEKDACEGGALGALGGGVVGWEDAEFADCGPPCALTETDASGQSNVTAKNETSLPRVMKALLQVKRVYI
jgi:hypothetical protein